MPEWFSPREIAAARRVGMSKILAFIHSGELEAVNMAVGRLGRPRWRVSAAALQAFDQARSNRARLRGSGERKVRGGASDPRITQFF